MAKVIVSIGYKDYVMDTKDAMAVVEAMGSAQLYESKYRDRSEGGSTYHIWDQTLDDAINVGMKLLPDNLYRLAKLAGKPTE